MSFSSADWTIPELCVWIVERSKEAINKLSQAERSSLDSADRVCLGAYAARDDVISEAQEGRLSVFGRRALRTAREQVRESLTPIFWKSAEILPADWVSGGVRHVVARSIGEGNSSGYTDLLVSSAQAQEIWERQPMVTSDGANTTSAEAAMPTTFGGAPAECDVTWWNVVQAAVWIEAKDPEAVSWVGPEVGLATGEQVIPGSSLYRAHLYATVAATAHGRTALDIRKGQAVLGAACAAGSIEMFGRRRGKGDVVPIPTPSWAGLVIRDDGPRGDGVRGIIATVRDQVDHTATWWDHLRVRAADVQAFWPAAAQTCEPAAEATKELLGPWMVREMERRSHTGETRLRGDMVLALREEHQGIGERTARRLFKDVPLHLKTGRGRKPVGRNSGQD